MTDHPQSDLPEPTLADVVTRLDELQHELRRSNDRNEYRFRLPQWVIKLAVTLIASALVSEVLYELTTAVQSHFNAR